ncbi:MAG TPA: DHCW motif cupin fold protein [Terriglobales bacterium]|nr:DHCW motif cupin fold protein [Terriglobales bacterium]
MLPTEMVVTDWSKVPVSEHPGDYGVATWRTQVFGDIRVRMVEYSPGYSADHWCSKGHVLFCLNGALNVKIADGKKFVLQAGHSYYVGDGDPPHRSSTETGAQLFIVD